VSLQYFSKFNFQPLGLLNPTRSNNIARNNASHYRDQTDVFYDSPIKYLSERFPSQVNLSFPLSPSPSSIPGQTTPIIDWKHEWPKYLVVFGALLNERGVGYLLMHEMGYVEVWRAGNGIEEDRRRRGGVRVLKISS
jgi:GPI mannosyltransferase 3